MKTMDAHNPPRRLRWSPPQARSELGNLEIGPTELALFAFINRHGPLPAGYLHHFVAATNTNKNAFQAKLTRLYNGSGKTPSLLSRPAQQFQNFRSRYQPLIYDLNRASQALLAEQGIELIKRGDPFLHRFMLACCTSSIELTARSLGIRYIPRIEVLTKSGAALAHGKTIPDDIFGLQYKDGTYAFLVLEVDRNTESIVRTGSGYVTYATKLEAYLRIMNAGTFRTHWGIPNMKVLTVTTNATHEANLLQQLDRLTQSSSKFNFGFKTKNEFGTNWMVPDLMDDLLVAPWVTPGRPLLII